MGILKGAQAAIYRLPVWGELIALRRLFSPTFLNNLKATEEASHDRHMRVDVAIDLAWIDKIPLARFDPPVKDLDNKPITEGVELGDVLIVRTSANANSGALIVTDSRSAVIQAKVTSKLAAKVPVGRTSGKHVTSTSKELKLLTDWPQFDLHETSGSRDAYIEDVNVDASLPHSFFWAFNTSTQEWTSAVAKKDQLCDEVLDDFFENLRKRVYGADRQQPTEWARLTAAVLSIARARTLPPSLGPTNSRVQTADYHKAGFNLPLPKIPRMAVLFIDTVQWEGHSGSMGSLYPGITGGSPYAQKNRALAGEMIERLHSQPRQATAS